MPEASTGTPSPQKVQVLLSCYYCLCQKYWTTLQTWRKLLKNISDIWPCYNLFPVWMNFKIYWLQSHINLTTFNHLFFRYHVNKNLRCKNGWLDRQHSVVWKKRGVRNQETAGLWDCAEISRKAPLKGLQTEKGSPTPAFVCVCVSWAHQTLQAQRCRV